MKVPYTGLATEPEVGAAKEEDDETIRGTTRGLQWISSVAISTWMVV